MPDRRDETHQSAPATTELAQHICGPARVRSHARSLRGLAVIRSPIRTMNEWRESR
jgi:hypothetical protein